MADEARTEDLARAGAAGADGDGDADATGASTGAGEMRRSPTVEAAFALLVVASVGERLWFTRHSWFYLDDWPLALRARHLGDFVDPYNGHLSVVLLGIYRSQMELFGFGSYLPLRVAGALSFAGVGVAVYLALRSRRGSVVAAVGALPLVWFRNMTLEPAALNHYLSVVGGVGCAYLLSRRSSRRVDLSLGVALAFSLAAAGSGVAVAAACFVHVACTRAPWRRWIAVALPTLCWGLWWLRYVGDPPLPGNATPADGLGDLARTVASNVVGSFQQLALGNRVVGVVLLVLFVARGAVLARQGLSGAAGFLAWSAALVTWWLGLALSRGTGAIPSQEFRYAFVAAGFIVIALVPAGPRTETARDPLHLGSRWAARVPSTVAVVIVLVVGAFLAVMVRGDVERSSHDLAQAGCVARLSVVMVDRVPPVVDGDAVMPITMYLLPASQVRTLTDAYGHPFGRTQSAVKAVEDDCT